MRTCSAVLGVALALTGCSSTVPGTATPGGALLVLADDVDLGIAYTGGGGRLEQVALDSSDSPVLLSSTEFVAQAGITRGTDVSTSVPVAALAEGSPVTAMAVAPNDTVVMVGNAGVQNRPSVIRVSPDGTERSYPLALPDVVDPIRVTSSLGNVGTAFSPHASLVVLTDVPTDDSQGFPVDLGKLQVAVVDTTTGAATEVVEVQLADPSADVPGQDPLVRVEDVVMGPDGGVLVAVGLAGQDSRLLRFDASLNGVSDVPYARPADDVGTFLALDDEGTAYLTQTADGVQLLRFAADATEPEVVATLAEDSTVVRGLAVDPSGTWGYVTALTDTELGQTVTAVDLATGVQAPRTSLCDEGFAGPPLLGRSGETLLVSAQCSDVSTNQEHLYVLRAA
ncbi:MAG: hypothetical protein F2825_10980 [Actinobacteria bacterium]|uniref:Unannotated protein n=1 Tax=freshwater metagenome TaxID=449393 RepID=A0A6J7IRI9_9ZZZZ|nr:hypothetical protein [Actinomycetota bacterium]